MVLVGLLVSALPIIANSLFGRELLDPLWGYVSEALIANDQEPGGGNLDTAIV